MRPLAPCLLLKAVFILASTSGTAQGQAATRPEPPPPESVIPASAIPGIEANPPAPSPAPVRPKQYDPLLDLPPLPAAKVTLIGGTVTNLAELLNQMAFQPFGTKKEMRVHFDTRTRFFRDGAPVSEREIKQGQRVYLDTMLNADRVFAKTIWIRGAVEAGTSRGQIAEIDLTRNRLT